MIHAWLRYVLIWFAGLTVLALLLFGYVCWVSPASRLGKHHQQQSYRVRPGMPVQQAMHLMGPPQKQEVLGEEVLYTYSAHPFAADNVYLAINRDGLVKTISHGE